MSVKKSIGFGRILYIILIVSLVIFIITFTVYYFENREELIGAKYAPDNVSVCGPFTRLANVNDFEISESYSFPLGVKITIKAKIDVRELCVSWVMTDSYGNYVSQVKEEIGTMKRGQEYDFSIQLFDIPLTDILQLENTKIVITRGKILKWSISD